MDGEIMLSKEREMATIKVEEEGHYRGGMESQTFRDWGKSFLERKGCISLNKISAISCQISHN